jgi:hypothetical protein
VIPASALLQLRRAYAAARDHLKMKCMAHALGFLGSVMLKQQAVRVQENLKILKVLYDSFSTFSAPSIDGKKT